MDERVKALKPGDRVGVSIGREVDEVKVIVVTPDGILYTTADIQGIVDVYFCGFESIVWNTFDLTPD